MMGAAEKQNSSAQDDSGRKSWRRMAAKLVDSGEHY